MRELRGHLLGTVTPLILAVLFVLENIAFNHWLGLPQNPTPWLFAFECFTFALLVFGPSVLLSRRKRLAYNLIISSLLALLFIAQYLNFSYSGGFLQASALKYAGQAGDEMSTVLQLLSPRLFLFLSGPLAAIALAFAPFERNVESQFTTIKTRLATIFCILLVGASGYLSLLGTDSGWTKELLHPILTLHDLGSFSFSSVQSVEREGIANFYFGDVIGMFLRSTKVTPEQLDFVRGTIANKTIDPQNKYFGKMRGENLIFLQVESLDAATIGKKVGGIEITPNLNKLAKEGVFFDRYFTQIGPGNTADAEFVTLTSMYPLTNTVAFIDFAHDKFDSLPNLLSAHGYTTAALHGDVPDFWNRANIYPGLGYKHQISKKDFTVTEDGFPTLDDDDFLVQSADKMADLPRPFMATAITLSSHTPFDIPDADQVLQFPTDSSLTARQQAYLQSVHYTDGAIGKFIDELKANGLYNDSLIAIYGDHGSFTGTDLLIDASTTGKMPATLTNSQVPLILLSPKFDKKARGTNMTPGSHLDLYPTVADLLGFSPPSTAFGHDLFDPSSAIMTHRDPYTDVITDIITPVMTYTDETGTNFEDGNCSNTKTGALLPLASCADLFSSQRNNIRASDLIVRGNLLPKLAKAK